MLLSIVIVNFKNPPLLRLCLKSLARIGVDDHEIIVVDSQSTIETQNVVNEEFASTFKQLKLVPFKENIGYTKGVNEGIKAATGEYFLILNPDIVAIKGSIESMLNHVISNPGIGLIGPRLLNFDDSTQQSCFRSYSLLIILCRRIGYLPFASRVLDKFLLKDKDLTKTTEVDWLMGSAIMTSRKATDKVGLMDEKLFLYVSEVDWARRFWENGYKVVYYPQSTLYHYHQRESKGRFGLFDVFFRKETRWHLKDAAQYFKKYGLRAPETFQHNSTRELYL